MNFGAVRGVRDHLKWYSTGVLVVLDVDRSSSTKIVEKLKFTVSVTDVLYKIFKNTASITVLFRPSVHGL